VTVHLRSQVPATVLAAGPGPIRVSWHVLGDRSLAQEAYELQAGSDPLFATLVGSTGTVSSAEQVAIAAPGPELRSREVRYLRARIRTAIGWSDWSQPLRIEAGLLDMADWRARPITLPGDAGADHQAPAVLLRRVINLEAAPASARLYVTALGLHAVRINGHAVSEDLLAPGWTAYQHRLIADTYDVTGLLHAGENVIAATIGDGWYRGRLGFKPGGDRRTYGSEIALLAQLEVRRPDGTVDVIASDATWQASTGEIRSADLYDGAVIDLRHRQDGWDRPGFVADGWRPARVLSVPLPAIGPRTAPPVRVIDVRPSIRTDRGAGVIQLDGGQNVAGYVRLRVRGAVGTEVRVRHAEVLEPEGSLHLRALRSAKATDVYTLADGDATVLEPAFTFHGFRYAEVATEAEVLEAEIVAISSATPPRATFASSHAGLNQLHSNVVWSQRDNFVSVPTDCPQRDERLGWTGDAQAFAATGSTLCESEAFWRSWLRDLALEQDPVLGVPSVVPNVVLDGPLRIGRAGWGDAATIVPWAVYESYGDASILEAQRASMRAWVDSLVARRGTDGLLVASPQFGDWLDPDAPVDRPWEAKADSDMLANAFFVHSARLAADAERVLGDPRSAARYGSIADDVAARTWARWAEHVVTTQTGCAAVLRLGVVPDGERASVGEALAALVRDAQGRVGTGFLGTPLVLPALYDTGHVDEAYRMLLGRDLPSWLYQVDHGATTTWERWDAIRPDGSIQSGALAPMEGDDEGQDAHMLSFNHYAYGAVIDWVYRHVAGLAPTLDAPGYRRVIIAPRPHVAVDWAKGTIDAAVGRVAIDWRLESGILVIEVDLPFGVSARLDAPVTPASVVTVDGSVSSAVAEIDPGSHVIVVTSPRIAGT
jgi:alpha-L-rhamnosidase